MDIRSLPPRAARVLAVLALSLAMLGAAGPSPPAPAADGLRPGEYTWHPDLAPRGPVAVIVSLPAQRAYVYRNGVRIGTSTVSTGKPGFETPAGVYTILQKRREHRSNLYDDAPMPFMQRLTWDGIALHAGSLPGFAASHGCIRLPDRFAAQLYAATAPGTVVVVATAEAFPPAIVAPGLFSPVDASGAARTPPSPTDLEGWFPERATQGPLTVLLSLADRELVVLRNAIEIGRARVEVDDAPAIGTRAYLLLEGTRAEPSSVLPDRPALRWLSLPVGPGGAGPENVLRAAFASGRIVVPPALARAVYDALRPGATVIVTDEPLRPRVDAIDVFESEGAARPSR
jgi:hypothetical protein